MRLRARERNTICQDQKVFVPDVLKTCPFLRTACGLVKTPVRAQLVHTRREY